jgi:prephenate dehydrogenase
MATKIAIIGLRQIGASIGLSLAQIKDQISRVGNDRDLQIAKRAEKLGAVDKPHSTCLPQLRMRCGDPGSAGK